MERILIRIGILIFIIIGVTTIFRILSSRIIKNKNRGLENIILGIPSILYFMTPYCQPCRIIQRPELKKLEEILNKRIHIIEINAVEEKELADYWGVLSVPTTFIIDSGGQPRQINHGVTSTEKLLKQLVKVEGNKILDGKNAHLVQLVSSKSE